MENKNVCYIDYLDSYLDVLNDKFPKWIKRVVYFLFNYCGFVKKKENVFILYCVENDVINYRMFENLINRIKENDYSAVVLADKIFNNFTAKEIFKQNNIEVLDGKRLYKFLALEILQKIAYVQGKRLENMEISLLVNNESDFNIENIKLLAQKCKVLNIVTNSMRQFQVVERYVLDEFGCLINVSRNKQKACMYSDVVINLDFSLDEITECNFKKKTVLVQLTGERFELRDGITILSCLLKFPTRYMKIFQVFSHFNEAVVYEACLYYKNSFANMRKILKDDGVGIRYFIGNNGKIAFREFK